MHGNFHLFHAVATSVAVVPVGVVPPVVLTAAAVVAPVVLTAAAVVAVGVLPPVVLAVMVPPVGVVPPVVLAVPPIEVFAIMALLHLGIAFCDACNLFHQLSHATQHAGNEAQGRRPFVQPLPWILRSLMLRYHLQQTSIALILLVCLCSSRQQLANHFMIGRTRGEPRIGSQELEPRPHKYKEIC